MKTTHYKKFHIGSPQALRELANWWYGGIVSSNINPEPKPWSANFEYQDSKPGFHLTFEIIEEQSAT